MRIIFLLIFYVYHESYGFRNHERRKKVHAPSAWLPEKEVAICLYAIHTEVIVIVNSVVRHVTWIYEWFIYMHFSGNHGVSVITSTIDTLFTQLYTSDNCSLHGPCIAHRGKWVICHAWCVGRIIIVSGFSSNSRKLFIDANISRIFTCRKQVFRKYVLKI